MLLQNSWYPGHLDQLDITDTFQPATIGQETVAGPPYLVSSTTSCAVQMVVVDFVLLVLFDLSAAFDVVDYDTLLTRVEAGISCAARSSFLPHC